MEKHLKIYTKCVWQLTPDGAQLLPHECESFDYAGPVALCGFGGSPPPPPDFVGAASAQGAANRETALQSGILSNPSVTNPLGSRDVTYSQGAGDLSGYWIPQVNESLTPEGQARFAQEQQIMRQLGELAQFGIGRVSDAVSQPFDVSGLAPQVGSIGTNLPAGTGNVQQPPVRSSFDSWMPQMGLANPGTVRSSFNFDPNITASAGGTSIPTAFADVGREQRTFGDAGQLQNALNFAGISQLPGIGDFSADRQRVEQAIYSRLEPQFQRDEAAMRSRLANQGITPGSEAYNRDLDAFNRAREDARQQAILAGGAEQSRLFGLGLAARQQGVGENVKQGEFANAAQAQAYLQALGRGAFSNAAQQQAFGQAQGRGQFAQQGGALQFQQNLANAQLSQAAQEQAYRQALGSAAFGNQAVAQQFQQNLGAGQFANQAQNQLFGQQMAGTDLYNRANQQQFGQSLQNAQLANSLRGQTFNEQLGAGQFANQARQQALTEQAYLRQLPLNEINALRSGSQVQMPQFANWGGQNMIPPPLMNAAQAQYQGGLDSYNAQVGAQNSTMSGLFGLGGSALMSPWFSSLWAGPAAVGAGALGAGAGAGAASLVLSDRRLKSRIIKVGIHPLGIGIYEYDIFGERQRGVMADEVLTVRPEAVLRHPTGYLLVDYGRL